jgi:hypothetical protein
MALVDDHDGKRLLEWFPEMFSDMSPVTGYGSEFPAPNDPDVTLYQFSGLLDKDGKEIYEGHIVEDNEGRICEVRQISQGKENNIASAWALIAKGCAVFGWRSDTLKIIDHITEDSNWITLD